MTSENQIMDLLTRRRGHLFCEQCIALELQLYNPRKIKDAVAAIGSAKGFRRAPGTCSRCGGEGEGIKAG